jgi:hypothetical protein
MSIIIDGTWEHGLLQIEEASATLPRHQDDLFVISWIANHVLEVTITLKSVPYLKMLELEHILVNNFGKKVQVTSDFSLHDVFITEWKIQNIKTGDLGEGELCERIDPCNLYDVELSIRDA